MIVKANRYQSGDDQGPVKEGLAGGSCAAPSVELRL
jgi:hypothetical protein